MLALTGVALIFAALAAFTWQSAPDRTDHDRRRK